MKKQAFLILSKIESKEGKITIYTEMLNYKEYQNNHHTNLTKITVEPHWEMLCEEQNDGRIKRYIYLS